MVVRRRLDGELVRRGLVDSRVQAVGLIEAGQVLVGGSVAHKPSRLVGSGDPVVVKGPPPRYVGRGGHKLEAGLAHFEIDPTGRRAMDVGASTGGFTDCLLQHGASTVTALDVGHGQIHERIRRDKRVNVLERTDIRDAVGRGVEPAAYGLIVVDVSFISLRALGAPVVHLAQPQADLIVLVKPQFEVGRTVASRARGVIRDPGFWREALRGAIDAFDGAGATMMGVMVSPLRGADGNVEFLVHFRTGSAQVEGTAPVPRAIDEVVAEAAREQLGRET